MTRHLPWALGLLLLGCPEAYRPEDPSARADMTAETTPESPAPDQDMRPDGPQEPGVTQACAAFAVEDERFPSSLAKTYLDIHNTKRAQYCLRPLRWDANLARVAQAYAEKGAGDLPHNDDRNAEYAALLGCVEDCPELGENISWQEPWDFWPVDTLANGWLEEEDWEPGCNRGGAHYTQMVQEDTTAVGCGAWVDPANDRLHFVCNYLGWQYGGDAFPDANCTCAGDPLAASVACP